MVHANFKIWFSLLVLGLFLIPNVGYACTKKQNIPSIQKTKSEQKIIKRASDSVSSCETGNCKGGCCNKSSHSCEHGDCGDACVSAPSFNFYAVESNADFSHRALVDSFDVNRFFYLIPNYSFGFISIWQPPKIG